MKTENTLRTVRNSLLCFFTALGAGFLVACGGGGGGVAGGGGGDSSSGTFHASDWVVGLDYTGSGGTGKTGERGVFPFQKGQTVSFSIGQVTLGSFVSNADEDFVTPTRIASGDRAINIERLLIALDSDVTVAGGATNGTITLNAESATDAAVVWSTLTVANAAAGEIMLGNDDGVTVARSIPSAADATRFLENTNNCGFSGAFEGTWRQPADGSTGDTALVLLAFNTGRLSAVNNPITVRGVGMSLDHIVSTVDAERPTGAALYFNLWKEGGSSQSNVDDFGGDAGVLPLAIGLRGFPVVTTITTEEGRLLTLTVESYDRMTYTSAEETGEYRRVKEEVRNADYRIAGFYSDADNGETPRPEAEIGIYAFSANAGGGSVQPYVGWFSSPLDGTEVYSNIGEGRISSPISYTWTPRPGISDDGTTNVDGMMVITDDSDLITVSFTHDTRVVGRNDDDSADLLESNGYGAFQHHDDTPDGTELLGGWCAL